MHVQYDGNDLQIQDKTYSLNQNGMLDLMNQIKTDYMNHGDIPNSAYEPISNFDFDEKDSKMSIVVEADGIVITDTSISTPITLVGGEQDINVLCDVMAPKGIFPRQSYLGIPEVGKKYGFDTLKRSDFKENRYTFKKSIVNKRFEKMISEIKIYLLKDSVILGEFNRHYKTVTFRRSGIYEHAYMIYTDLDEGSIRCGDFTVRAEDLEKGIAIPILHDALKAQSQLTLVSWSSGTFYRDITFREVFEDEFEDIFKINDCSAFKYNWQMTMENTEIFYELTNVETTDSTVRFNWVEPNGGEGCIGFTRVNGKWELENDSEIIDETPYEVVAQYLFELFINDVFNIK